ncbi:hypothetical protein [Nocardioides speluncae]|uniref:hypothetical protein n=1 Tax=Nocardioides speluncae TaxID=2670337 RepID=UPI00137A2EA9|nr:hypothetical protein [Nocardioides speluncae]
MHTSRLTYLEGLPGLGKTTTAITLAAQADDAALVSENNPAPADHKAVADLDPVEAAQWYLHGEIPRSHYAASLAASGQNAAVICDKGALATLAYLYALSRTGTAEDSAYQQVRREYLTHVRPHLPVNARTVVFAGPVALSLRRRECKPDRADRPLWYDQSFLDAHFRFYLTEAPRLRHGPLAVLDATGHPAATVQRAATLCRIILAATASDGRGGSGRVLPTPADQLESPFRAYAARAGAAVFGQALGAPFHQHGALAQPFERHLLLHRDERVVLQCSLWRHQTALSSNGGSA